jgi:hypothetical protein
VKDVDLSEDEGTKPKHVAGGQFTLVEQMLNKKDFEKYKNDIKKIKAIVADMQKYVTDHQLIINKELVKEQQLLL